MISVENRHKILGALLIVSALISILPVSPYAELRGAVKYVLTISFGLLGIAYLIKLSVRRWLVKLLIWFNFIALCVITLGDPEQLEPREYGNLSYVYLAWTAVFTIACLYLVDGRLGSARRVENSAR